MWFRARGAPRPLMWLGPQLSQNEGNPLCCQLPPASVRASISTTVHHHYAGPRVPSTMLVKARSDTSASPQCRASEYHYLVRFKTNAWGAFHLSTGPSCDQPMGIGYQERSLVRPLTWVQPPPQDQRAILSGVWIPTTCWVALGTEATLLIQDVHQASLSSRTQSTERAGKKSKAICNKGHPPSYGSHRQSDPWHCPLQVPVSQGQDYKGRECKIKKNPSETPASSLWCRRTPFRKTLDDGYALCHPGWVKARLTLQGLPVWGYKWCPFYELMPFVAAQSKHPHWLLNLGPAKNACPFPQMRGQIIRCMYF